MGRSGSHACRDACTDLHPQVLRLPKPPPVLAEHFDEALYRKTQAYSIDKWCEIHMSAQGQGILPPRLTSSSLLRWLGLFRNLYSFAETVALLLFKVLPWIWIQSDQLIRRQVPHPLLGWLRGSTQRFELAQTVVFVLILLVSRYEYCGRGA